MTDPLLLPLSNPKPQHPTYMQSPIAAEEEKGEGGSGSLDGVDAGTGFPSPEHPAGPGRGQGNGKQQGVNNGLRKARRKLSIMSDNALVRGCVGC